MQCLSSHYLQDLDSTPPTISRSNRPIKYVIWCPNPRMQCQAPTLKAVLKMQAGPIVTPPAPTSKRKAPKGQSTKVISRKKARKDLTASSSATQVSLQNISLIIIYCTC